MQSLPVVTRAPATSPARDGDVRHDWTLEEVVALYRLPFFDLVDRARAVHRRAHPPDVQLCTLLSVKTGGCPEDCKYCPQSSHYETAYRRSLESLRWTQVLMGDPKTVGTVIVRALTARWPSARYLVGYDAQLVTLTDMVLPTAVKDRLSRLMLGL